DQYGTVAQADAIARRVHPCDLLVLPDCGHVPHRERADETLSASVRFLAATAAP
ncbi:MAG: alpha/beta hydrolase, partial [Candidatus Eremiobacteraeota bacterium]|nr:alpha/beta hydrolase [Candidatus Eremiobacteraeota bacterium]